MSGYTKEKAEQLIKQHEDKASELEKEANKLNESAGTHPGAKAEVAELLRDARRERERAEAARALKAHHGD